MNNLKYKKLDLLTPKNKYLDYNYRNSNNNNDIDDYDKIKDEKNIYKYKNKHNIIKPSNPPFMEYKKISKESENFTFKETIPESNKNIYLANENQKLELILKNKSDKISDLKNKSNKIMINDDIQIQINNYIENIRILENNNSNLRTELLENQKIIELNKIDFNDLIKENLEILNKIEEKEILITSLINNNKQITIEKEMILNSKSKNNYIQEENKRLKQEIDNKNNKFKILINENLSNKDMINENKNIKQKLKNCYIKINDLENNNNKDKILYLENINKQCLNKINYLEKNYSKLKNKNSKDKNINNSFYKIDKNYKEYKNNIITNNPKLRISNSIKKKIDPKINILKSTNLKKSNILYNSININN